MLPSPRGLSCPDENTLVEFAEGALLATQRAAVEEHIDGCAECAELVAELVRGSSTPDARTIVDGGPSVAAVGTVRAGQTHGRYVLLARVGMGGMGQVWAAYDPELERRVALKVLRPELADPTAASRGRARLLREAQAMAKLSHPNVITVHDVGTVEDRVFVAMELVEGRDLKEWNREPGRTWREVLDMYMQAGEGLAAAHRAGLLHRDFKPSNVIVGDDGLARVLDFGLARGIDLADEGEIRVSSMSASGSGVPVPLTATGVVMGTPAYMAPEQYHGAETDARSDQYNFCVALWEGLYKERPYSGSTFEELRAAVLEDRKRPPPRERAVPAWLHRAVVRGLAPQAEDRFPSMEALLTELRRVPRRRRIRAIAFASTIGIGVFGWLAYAQGRGEAPTVCASGEEKVEPDWNPAVKQALRDQFEQTEVAYADSSFRAVERGLDDFAARWSAAYVDACEATHVRGEQSATLLDRRMGCLDEVWDEFRATVSILENADATVVRKAPNAVEALSRVERCADRSVLESGVAVPDASIAEDVARARRQLAQTRAMHAAGRLPEALALAKETLDDAQMLDYRPLLAQALTQVGDLEDWSGDPNAAEATLGEALKHAEAVGDDELGARIWTILAFILGSEQARFGEAHLAADYAGAKIERLGEPDDLAHALLTNRAGILFAEGKYPEALDTHQQALALLEPDQELRRMRLLDNLGAMHLRLGDREAARAAHREAVEGLTKALGPDHPQLAASLSSLASVDYADGNFTEALAPAERAVALLESNTSGPSPFLGAALNNLANIQSALNEPQQAAQTHRRALEQRIAVFGESHPAVAMSLSNLAFSLGDLGRHDEALALHERSLAMREESNGADHVENAYPLQGIGNCALALGDTQRAISALERALALRETTPGDPAELGQVQFLLGKALWTQGKERGRAIELARRARESFAQVDGEADRKQLADIDEWLAERGN